MTAQPLRIAFCLPGLNRVVRGAEVALESVATELARSGHAVTLIGSGEGRPTDAYSFLHAACLYRERFEGWRALPALRSETAYEELSFIPGFLRQFAPASYDVVVTCSYPFLNWAVRLRRAGRKRPLHVFVTQNGDWPLKRMNSEFRLFGCDGAVCTNPDYFDDHRDAWPARLIPNGVDPELFHPGPRDRGRFNLSPDGKVALMVSALVPSKRVLEGIQAASLLPGLELIVAGDGPQRDEVQALGRERLGGRFHLVRLPRSEMPDLYRAADVFLHMSTDEPSANAYIEAMASGVPIVTHDRRVTRWTIGDHGKLVDTSSFDNVAAALGASLGERFDTVRLVEATRDRFAWRAIAREYDTFFRELLATRDAS